MMSNRFRVIVAAMTVVLLLTPALIWSDKKPSRAAVDQSQIKLPPMSTAGPEQQPYAPTQIERKKLTLPVSYSSPSHDTRGLPRFNIIPKNTAYPGMTPAEIDKLSDMRAAPPPEQSLSDGQVETVRTIEDLPRTTGDEGLTLQEREKLAKQTKRQP